MDIAEYILPFLSGGLAGSVFTFTLNRFANRQTFSMRVQIFPVLGKDKQCLFNFLLLDSLKTVGWIDLILKIKDNTSAESWPSRTGLTCDLKKRGPNKLIYRIDNMRKDDFVNILFVVPDDLALDNLSASDLVDYNSSDPLIPKIDEADILLIE